uniref:uncharacterized protein LOC122580864 n=1 Tax=Erigeron canadensis TaxID=72917 RepID=UPI001CB91EDA|nr:uncharacterized protein LOC122580864 [Erigeron canadensis]
MRYTTFTLEEWWESHATSFGAFHDAVRYSPILEHTSSFIELYHLMVHRLGIWSEYESPSKFRCLTQKHLDKLFDIYEEECDLSQEARNEHMSSLQEFIREDDSNLLDDNETYLLEPGPSETFDEIDIILKSKVKESALINPSSVFASYPAFRFILKRV